MKNILVLSCFMSCSCAYAQNTIDNYTTSTNTFTEIANSTHGIGDAQDLDYVPGRRSEWWILNKEATAANMVIIYDAGIPSQTHQKRKDSHADHFMARSVAFTFGDNNYFVTAQEIQSTDGSTFMGPALWSSDTSIFARLHQNNWVPGELLGSHIDMLHQSPYGMGVAHDHDNVYWYFDGHNGNICKYDYAVPHGVGEDDHSDGKIHRYSDVTVTRVPNQPSHMVVDKQNSWLYFIDGSTKKVRRLKTTSGSIGGNLTPSSGSMEPLAEYKEVTGAQVEDVVTSGLTKPVGIDYRKDRLLVTDNATGNIHIYNVSAMPATLVGTIITGGPGVRGVRIDWNNKIWYVNGTTQKVMRIDNPNVVSVDDVALSVPQFNIYPNPVSGTLNINLADLNGRADIRITDMTGKVVYQINTAEKLTSIVTSSWAKGMYTVQLAYNNTAASSRIVVQ
ncbi:MAG: hypothetical protein K0R82_1407 [Flavipsychrobacter sp.]|nr:hypothetical protein [Flavipsychrobacter sp.]